MGDKEGNNRKKDQTPPPEKIVYDTVFENHDILMEGYKSVLKKSISTGNIFCTKFVESHIYKKLKMVRKIYSVEIATLPDSNTHRKTLNDLVENIDKFQRDLSYFPNISTKAVISIIVPILVAIAAICSIPEIWSQIVAEPVGLLIFLLPLLAYLCAFFFLLAVFSFENKRLLFIFPEYKRFSDDESQKGSDKRKKRGKAFSWKKIEGTIYDKENKLFESLKMIKIPEQGVDVLLIQFCITIITAIGMFIVVAISDYDYRGLLVGVMIALSSVLLIILFLIEKRRAR